MTTALLGASVRLHRVSVHRPVCQPAAVHVLQPVVVCELVRLICRNDFMNLLQLPSVACQVYKPPSPWQYACTQHIAGITRLQTVVKTAVALIQTHASLGVMNEWAASVHVLFSLFALFTTRKRWRARWWQTCRARCTYSCLPPSPISLGDILSQAEHTCCKQK